MSTHSTLHKEKTSWLWTSRSGLWAACLGAYGMAALSASLIVESGISDNLILITLYADIIATCVIFLAVLLFRNSSLYDPYWSVAPILIAVYWLSIGLTETANPIRAFMVTAVVCLWGVRLTYNCMRRWRSLQQEDFRYQDLRAKHGPLYWLVDLFGIELTPTLLVFLGCLPLYPALVTSTEPVGWVDLLALTLTLSAITIEARADTQLRRFLNSNSAEGPAQGNVCTVGLWSWSRHPNYFGEMLFWWGLAVFGLAAAPGWLWSLLGASLITLLFVAVSIPMMQERNRLKRPNYDAQVKGISILLPRPRKVS